MSDDNLFIAIRIKRSLALCAAIFFASGGALIAANTLTVNSAADAGGTCPGADCTLRQAIATAAPGDTVNFSLPANSTILLTSDQLLIHENLTINGPGANLLTVQRNAATSFRIFEVDDGAQVTFSGLTIKNGDAADASGGGIYNRGGTVNVISCTLSGNTSNDFADGGAILNLGTVNILNSTLNDNSAAVGGAVSNDSSAFGPPMLNVTNSTLSGNSATHGDGGGIYNGQTGIVNVTNSTLSANSTTGSGGGISNNGANEGSSDGTVNVKSSIVALNTGASSPDVDYTFTSQGYNLIGKSDGSTGFTEATDQVGTIASPRNPQLGPLQGNGGPTFTQALLTGSTAIDKGSRIGLTGNLTTDQRGTGFSRTIDNPSIVNATGGDGSDIGAFEAQTTTPTVQFSSATYNVTRRSGSATITVTKVGTAVVSVDYATSDGTATAGQDYTAASGTLTFARGETSKTFTVSILTSNMFQGDETIHLTLGNPQSTSLGIPSTATLTISPVTLANISTRMEVETGDNALIGGFIITGNQPKKLMLRAIGPSLPVPGKLADPQLELYNSSNQLIDSNDNWQDAPNKQAIIDSTIAPKNDKESAILRSLTPAAYTVIVRGVANTTGVALVEAYDLDPTADSQLSNISTRGFVQTGDDVMIAGFIIVGHDSLKFIVRGIGPSLSINGSLADPMLDLYDGNGTRLQSNDNWKDTQQAEIEATGVAPTNNLESAIVRTVAPGNYTVVLRGANNTTGIAVVQIYALN